MSESSADPTSCRSPPRSSTTQTPPWISTTLPIDRLGVVRRGSRASPAADAPGPGVHEAATRERAPVEARPVGRGSRGGVSRRSASGRARRRGTPGPGEQPGEHGRGDATASRGGQPLLVEDGVVDSGGRQCGHGFLTRSAGLRWAQGRGPVGGVEAEEQADQEATPKARHDRVRRHHGVDADDRELRADESDGDADQPAEQRQQHGLGEELADDVGLLAPMALRMPISRVRSVTVTSMMFMTPMPPTRREIAATAPSSTVNVWLDEVAASRIEEALVTL